MRGDAGTEPEQAEAGGSLPQGFCPPGPGVAGISALLFESPCWVQHEVPGLSAVENAMCVCDGGERGALHQKRASGTQERWRHLRWPELPGRPARGADPWGGAGCEPRTP